MNKQLTEKQISKKLDALKGTASILIDYDQGKISVFHGTDKTLLASWVEKKEDNHFNEIWSVIDHFVEERKGYKFGQ